MRTAAAIVVGAAAAALGALILGEYEFTGTTPYVAGVLFGLAIAEVVLVIDRKRSVALGVAAGVLSAAGLLWAGYITVRNRRGEPIPGAAWVAAVLGLVIGYLRAGVVRPPPRAEPDAANGLE